MEVQKLNKTCSAIYLSGNDRFFGKHENFNKKEFTKKIIDSIKTYNEEERDKGRATVMTYNIKMVLFVSNRTRFSNWFSRLINKVLWIKKLKSYGDGAYLCAIMYKGSLGHYIDKNFIKI